MGKCQEETEKSFIKNVCRKKHEENSLAKSPE